VSVTWICLCLPHCHGRLKIIRLPYTDQILFL
jgi:hypothetical protein